MAGFGGLYETQGGCGDVGRGLERFDATSQDYPRLRKIRQDAPWAEFQGALGCVGRVLQDPAISGKIWKYSAWARIGNIWKDSARFGRVRRD